MVVPRPLPIVPGPAAPLGEVALLSEEQQEQEQEQEPAEEGSIGGRVIE